MSDEMTLQELEKTLPEGISLYDFGYGTKVAPKPDPAGTGYLTSHMFILIATLPNGKIVTMHVEISFLSGYGNVGSIRKTEFDKAVASFQKQLAAQV